MKKTTETQDLDRVLDLLQSLSLLGETGPDVKRISIELKGLARQVGAGGQAMSGEAHSRMRAAIEGDPRKEEELVKYLSNPLPSVRSWTGSYIEQLLPKAKATALLKDALSTESDAETASWFCLYLARLNRADKSVCELIQNAYTRFEGKESVEMHIARALGYAGCKDGVSVLRELLRTGGYDQQSVALDGLGALGRIEDRATIEVLRTFFKTTRFDILRRDCVHVLRLAAPQYSDDIVLDFINILSEPSQSRDFPHIVLDAIRSLPISPAVAQKSLPQLISALKYADAELSTKIVSLLETAYPDWEETFVDLIVDSPEDDLRTPLSRALGRTERSRHAAVELLNMRARQGTPIAEAHVAAALKEIGGEEAFESASLLAKRYIEPSNKLEETSRKLFEDTIRRMQTGYDTNMVMNRVIFALGVLVIAISILLVVANRSTQFFGASGVVAGLGTLLTLFYAGPLNRIHKAMTQLIQIEVAFLAFMHRLLQARSIFEQQYNAQAIDLDALSHFDQLFSENMRGTLELLEKYADLGNGG